ncbi:hypothetical protein bpr_I1660 [Butyrivibrio proteoclasticus B316]|uniref:Uncharacterized protein n=1 Tax=Butyrivibrio proteoclasticus (strain ATCC 51982 / DSM 14932 / B316) TaxID=515622 RepID=E0RWM3_BUTPB|nr:hypothetical protein [Butyrivibrio proteoclasticus]ADL34397.1 hypothetical protein bpr_I1660 [Butyrivibrio proteoclasticus B316]
MKKWNVPEITALDMNETANGLLDCECEFWFISNDSQKKCDPTPVTPIPTPVPETPEHVDQLS